MGISVPSMIPVAIVVLLLEVTEESVFRRRKLSSKRRISKPCFTGTDKFKQHYGTYEMF